MPLLNDLFRLHCWAIFNVLLVLWAILCRLCGGPVILCIASFLLAPCWWLVSHFFLYLGHRHWGTCDGMIRWGLHSATLCTGSWFPFDLSGHVFVVTGTTALLIALCLQRVSARSAFTRMLRVVLVIASVALILAWTLLLVQTILHYHSLGEKMLAWLTSSLLYLLIQISSKKIRIPQAQSPAVGP